MSVMAISPERTDLILWARAVDQAPPENWQSTLDRLKEAFGDRYSLRRLPSCWMATDRDPNTTTEPTIVQDSLEQFVRALLDPGPRYGQSWNSPHI